MTAQGRELSFGIKTSQMGLTYQEILSTWRQADQIPAISHAWLWDHMVPLRGDITGAALEAWTLLAALAAQTSRLRLGVIVTSNRLRNPALLAKMAATTDIIAGGRLDFGIGAGGSQDHRPEPRRAGVRGLRRAAGLSRRGGPRPRPDLHPDPSPVDRGPAVRLPRAVHPAHRRGVRAQAAPEAAPADHDRRRRRRGSAHRRRAR